MPRVYTNVRQTVLDAMPGTQGEIVEATGLHRCTVQRWTKRLYDSDACHIGGWARPVATGPFVPRYTAGQGDDKPCRLKPQSNQVKWKRYKAKLKAADSDAMAQRGRARYWRLKAIKKGDPLVNALFGRAA